MKRDEKWRQTCSDLYSTRLVEYIMTGYMPPLMHAVHTGSIREHFEKEIRSDLDRLCDLDCKLDGKIRGSITDALDQNFDGAGIDLESEITTEVEHELWEHNFRKLMEAVFRFANDPCQDTYDAMMSADPQINGAYE